MKLAHAFDRDGIVYVKGTLQGKRYRLSTHKRATTTNLKWVDKHWRRVIENILQDEEQKKVGEVDLVEYGYKSLEANEGSRKEKTNREYLQTFANKIAPHFKGVSLEELLPTDIKRWQSMLVAAGLSGSRIHNIRMVFQGIINDALADGIIKENPFRHIKGVPKGTPDISPFTLSEVKKIIREADGFFREMVTVAFFTGMRTGELIALRWEDINFASKKIRIQRSMRGGTLSTTKTAASNREIDMLPVVEKALKAQWKETGLIDKEVFLSSRGEGFKHADSLTKKHWYPLLKRAMIDRRVFYQTRHTFASIMISEGEDILWVSNMLGHADSSTTLKKYAKYRERETKRARFLDTELETVEPLSQAG